jgi:tryptophan synthase alpha chain
MMSGRRRIREAFEAAAGLRTAALMPYFTLGYPDRDGAVGIIEAVARHSDLLELGIPFSDPIADGPTIQRSTQLALDNGVSSADCLAALRSLRARGVGTPALLMGYYNPILAYGEESFVRDAAEAGADGLIVPDLPLEEAQALNATVEKAGMVLVSFLAPTSTEKRIALVQEQAKGFIYMVSVAGVTGARQTLSGDLAPFVSRIKAGTDVPVAVGFGISTPEQAAAVAAFADGVIVGSALIDVVDGADDKAAAAEEYVLSLQTALSLEVIGSPKEGP